MKTFRRIVPGTILALVCLNTAALAQSDEDTYNARYAAKQAQASSAATRLTAMYNQDDQLNQQVASLNSQIATLTTTVQQDNQALINAFGVRGADEAAFDRDQANLTAIQQEAAQAQSDMNSASANMTRLQGYISSDQSDVAWLWEEYDYWDPTDFVGMYNLLSDIADLNSEIAGLQAQLSAATTWYTQAQSSYNYAAGQIPQAQADVNTDNAAVISAQNSYSLAMSAFTSDSNQLDSLKSSRDQANSTLSNNAGQEPNLEDIVLAQNAWLSANPNYDAWVANGRP